MSAHGPEAHEKDKVDALRSTLVEIGRALRPTLPSALSATRVDVNAEATAGAKKVHLIRHGQGHHNVAQKIWHEAGRAGEPYWLSTDPELAFKDSELTPLGEQQARDLHTRSSIIRPELMVVSPMRRAILTGLVAFDDHIKGLHGSILPVVAHESAHEIAGKHTCDKRLSKSALGALYPAVDFSLIVDEDDPFWGDGTVREPLESVAKRAAELGAFLFERPEMHIVVAAHSTILAAFTNSILEVSGNDPADASWFGTGEMRTFLITKVVH